MLYQIVECKKNDNTAASKAVNDVVVVAEQLGFKRISVIASQSSDNVISKILRQLSYAMQWMKVYRQIPNNATLLLQHPFRNRQLLRTKCLERLKNKKNIRIISLVHDVEKLRGYMYSAHYEQEFSEMLLLMDSVIVHNETMKSYFVDQGVDERIIVNLEIFDYLTSAAADNVARFSKDIYLAGNLDSQKSGYTAKLKDVPGVHFVLYGVNFPPELAQSVNVEYRGVVKADELPGLLNAGFGLVWDGHEIATCAGGTGEYLKYNNPHKLSLYLASGIPVIIWNEAAESDFVRKNKVGLTVSSLQELESKLLHLSEDEYIEMANNTKAVSTKLINGDFTRNALNEALSIVEKD